MEEKEIIRRLIARDPLAQKALHKKWRVFLMHVALKIVRNKMDAEDILQISWLRIFDNIQSYQGEGQLKQWMAMVVRNTSITYLNKYKKYTAYCELLDWEPMQKRAPNFFDAITAGDIYRHSMKQLHELSGNQYMYARLFLEEQMDCKEISEDIDVPIGTVKSQVSRACSSLRKIIRELESEPLKIPA